MRLLFKASFEGGLKHGLKAFQTSIICFIGATPVNGLKLGLNVSLTKWPHPMTQWSCNKL